MPQYHVIIIKCQSYRLTVNEFKAMVLRHEMAHLQVPLVTLLSIAFLVVRSTAVKVPPPVKPNIVFVLVDDWGFSDVGFKNPKVISPNFDDLAKTGLVLNRHYV